MRRFTGWGSVLALSIAALGAAPGAPEITIEGGGGEGYKALGSLAVQDGGRVKPLDTYARYIIKGMYTREEIKLPAPNDKTVKWEPLAALLDIPARPDFWDNQEIIAFEYLPLKQKLISVPAREALARLAKSGKLSAEDRALVEEAAKNPNLTTSDLKAAAALKNVDEATAAHLRLLAHKLSPDQKWLSPNDLETGRIEVGDKEVAYLDWIVDLARRRPERPGIDREATYEPLEKKALEAATRLSTYQSIRDQNEKGDPFHDVRVVPRPLSARYLAYTTEGLNGFREAYKKWQEENPKANPQMAPNPTEIGLSALHLDAMKVWNSYVDVIKSTEVRDPGTDKEFDANYLEWLRERSPWIAERLILTADSADLKSAGYDEAKILAFRKAFADVAASEKKNPGKLEPQAALALVSAARDLGESAVVPYLLTKDTNHKTWAEIEARSSLGKLAATLMGRKSVAEFEKVRSSLATSNALSPEDTARLLAAGRSLSGTMVPYPSVAEVSRETSYNRFAPFYKAPAAYGIAVILLLMALGLNPDAGRASKALDRGFHVAALIAMFSGIMLEVIGFYYRIRITGWAPVTNMYETVIWVALVTSVLGFILELKGRKKYAALAASAVSLLATVLAANVSLLEPEIKNLAPVLRSNYWLTIHVLTIVSSYAAFALAMGLGMLGIGYYLSATYKRDAPIASLFTPIAWGVPMILVGGGLFFLARSGLLGPVMAGPLALMFVGIIPAVGASFVLSVPVGIIGEYSNRSPRTTSLVGAGIFVIGSVASVVVSQLPTPQNAITELAYPHTYLAVAAGLGLALMILAALGGQARSLLRRAEEAASAAKSALSSSSPVNGNGDDASPAFSSGSGGAGVATLRKPSVAEIRARQEAARPVLEPRAVAMQAVAARIKPLASFTYRAMQVGVLLVAAGTILGGVWADFSWGRFWGWDAKEVWALITLLVYLVPLHGRFAGWVNTFGLIFWSVVSFLSVLMAWYGVNFVLGIGLHSYGFVEGGGQGIVAAVVIAALALPLGAWWRRRVASMI